MGPFLRGFCSELVKTAEGSVGQPGYGYSSRENVPSAPTPFPGRGERGQPYHYRKSEEPWQPSPKPPVPIDTRKPIDPYPKAKGGAGKPSKPGRQGFPAAVSSMSSLVAKTRPGVNREGPTASTPAPTGRRAGISSDGRINDVSAWALATPEDDQRADRLKALLPPEPKAAQPASQFRLVDHWQR